MALEHSSGFSLAEALDAADIAACRELFAEYRQNLGVDLAFQGFERELASLPGDYARPRGRLLLLKIAGEPAGCVALRAIGDGAAEMKRLYVRPQFRGMGIGRTLALSVIDEARGLGYARIKLDTLPMMGAAQELYRELGFTDTAAYNDNPIMGTRFLELELAPRRGH